MKWDISRLQPACRWHIYISDWMEKNGYPTVNSEKTILMKSEGIHFISHMFVDDIMTSTKLEEEFIQKYPKDCKITGGDSGGGLVKTF